MRAPEPVREAVIADRGGDQQEAHIHEEDRLVENYRTILSELALLTTVSVLLFGFLLSSSGGFADSVLEESLYSVAIVLVATATLVFVLPVAYHHIQYPYQNFEKFTERTHGWTMLGLPLLGASLYLSLSLAIWSPGRVGTPYRRGSPGCDLRRVPRLCRNRQSNDACEEVSGPWQFEFVPGPSAAAPFSQELQLNEARSLEGVTVQFQELAISSSEAVVVYSIDAGHRHVMPVGPGISIVDSRGSIWERTAERSLDDGRRIASFARPPTAMDGEEITLRTRTWWSIS